MAWIHVYLDVESFISSKFDWFMLSYLFDLEGMSVNNR